MAKLDIPKFRYLYQDEDGAVIATTVDIKPFKDRNFWYRQDGVMKISNGNRNKNWRNTRIDLETDDYEFEDGILRRIEK